MRKYKVTDFEQFLDKKNMIEYMPSGHTVWRDGTIIGIDKIRGQVLIQDYLNDDERDWYSIYHTGIHVRQIVRFKNQNQSTSLACDNVSRNEITHGEYAKMMVTERHHDHVIIRDDNGILRWKKNQSVVDLIIEDEIVTVNDLVTLFGVMGYDKNTEIYRKLYRDLGTTISDYWRIFYSDASNARYYIPNKK